MEMPHACQACFDFSPPSTKNMLTPNNPEVSSATRHHDAPVEKAITLEMSETRIGGMAIPRRGTRAIQQLASISSNVNGKSKTLTMSHSVMTSLASCKLAFISLIALGKEAT